MDPVFAARLRRLWPLFLAVFVFALFTIVHSSVFQPQAARFRSAIAKAGSLGLYVDPAHPSQKQLLPVQVFTLLTSNSLDPAEADSRSQLGTLGAQMTQTLASMASRRGLEIVVAEPGQQTQLPSSIETRAHIKLRGRYASFVGLVDDLARDKRLWAIERFAITPVGAGRDEFDVWVASCLLKRIGSGS